MQEPWCFAEIRRLECDTCTLVEYPIAKFRKVANANTTSQRKLSTTKMPSTHKKEKPWDTDDIDKWKVRHMKLCAHVTRR